MTPNYVFIAEVFIISAVAISVIVHIVRLLKVDYAFMLFEQELRQNICDPNIPYQRLIKRLKSLPIHFGQNNFVKKQLKIIQSRLPQTKQKIDSF